VKVNKFNVFFEIHSDNPREGPGNLESTKRAFDSLTNLPENPLILDIGCGPGKQTFDLLELSNAKITAVDNHQPFLDSIQKIIDSENLSDRLQVFNQDMSYLDFDLKSFDLIWSEGAIYIMGFKNGLNNWKRFLKPKGFVAITEVSWLKENPPKKLADFWNAEYPSIQSIEKNLEIINKCNLKPVKHFTLPDSAWWEYYNPILEKLPDFKSKYKDNQEALDYITAEEKEIELFKQYSDYYGYVFYIIQKI